MQANLSDRKKVFLQNFSRLESRSNQVCEFLSELAEMPLKKVIATSALVRCDQKVQDFQKALVQARQEVIEARQSIAANEDSQEAQQSFLEIIKQFDSLDKKVRRAEDVMLTAQKERLSLLQELGERQQFYAHKLWTSIENEWANLSESPSKEKAFDLRIRMARTSEKFEEAEYLWYQVIDQRLALLKSCKKTSYFPQLLREASFLNDIAMRSTEFCEVFRANVEQFKLLPRLCEEYFLVCDDLKSLKGKVKEGSVVKQEAKQDLFWMRQAVKNCQHHTSAKRAFYTSCQATLEAIDQLEATLLQE